MKLSSRKKKNFCRALQAEELQRRDKQLLHAQLLQQNWELREAHDKKSQRNGIIEEVSEFHLRHYCEKKISRGSGYYSGIYWQDTGIAKCN